MKTTKKDYEKAWDYLIKNLEPIVKTKISNGDIKHENEVLHKALDVFFNYVSIISTLDSFKTKVGRQVDRKNEKVLHIALEECISELNGNYPSLQKFERHWNNPDRYKLPEPKKARNSNLKDDPINGIGYEKLKKFVQQYSNKDKRMEKLVELGILDSMTPVRLTRLSDLLKIK